MKILYRLSIALFLSSSSAFSASECPDLTGEFLCLGKAAAQTEAPFGVPGRFQVNQRSSEGLGFSFKTKFYRDAVVYEFYKDQPLKIAFGMPEETFTQEENGTYSSQIASCSGSILTFESTAQYSYDAKKDARGTSRNIPFRRVQRTSFKLNPKNALVISYSRPQLERKEGFVVETTVTTQLNCSPVPGLFHQSDWK